MRVATTATYADARLCGDARGRDGGVRPELAAGVVLRSRGRFAFGGKAKEAMSRVTDGGETCQAPMKAAIEQFRTQLGAAIESVDPVKRALDTGV